MGKMTSEDLKDLYKKETRDEKIVPLIKDEEHKDIIGFNVIRRYKNQSDNNFLIFINFYINKENFVLGNVDRVINKVEKIESVRSVGYTLAPDKKLLTFNLSESDNIKFDRKNKKVIFRNKKFSINEFINILEKNHFRKVEKIKINTKVYIKKIKLNILKIFLYFIFWLVDTKYKLERFTAVNEIKPVKIKEVKTYFGNFKIYRNLFLFSLLLIVILSRFSFFIKSVLFIFFNNSSPKLDNPISIICFILMLLVLEKMSIFLENNLNIKNGNYLYRLSEKYIRQYYFSPAEFKLKIK